MNVTTNEAENCLLKVPEQAPGLPVSPDAGERFYAQYKDWVDEQNRHFAEHGVFGEQLRAW